MNKYVALGGMAVIVVGGVVAFSIKNGMQDPDAFPLEMTPESEIPMKEVKAEETPASPEMTDAQKAAMKYELEEQLNDKANLELSYAHVVPGKYSEIYAVVSKLTPGQTVTAELLYGELLDGGARMVYKTIENATATADELGTAHMTWRITAYGDYQVLVRYTLPGSTEVGGLVGRVSVR